MSFLKSLNAKAIFNFFVALVNLFVLTTIIRSEVWVDVVQFLIHSIAAVVVVFVVYKLFQFASVCWYPNEEQKAQQCICVSQWVALKTKKWCTTPGIHWSPQAHLFVFFINHFWANCQ